MATFQLNDCSMNLQIEPLGGELVAADRRAAWRLYLALATLPALRDDQLPERALRDLIVSLQAMLEEWPAGEIKAPRPGHLGFLVVAMIEMVLLPCINRASPAGWRAVREFCHASAREIARTYGFPDAGANPPQDLLAAWTSA